MHWEQIINSKIEKIQGPAGTELLGAFRVFFLKAIRPRVLNFWVTQMLWFSVWNIGQKCQSYFFRILLLPNTVQKMKFSIKDYFSKYHKFW